MDRKPHRPADDQFGSFKSEKLRFVLHVLLQLRLAFEAAANSKWITWLVCSSTFLGWSAWKAQNLLLSWPH